MRLAVVGLAHPHVGIVLDELRHQPDVELVALSDPSLELRAQYNHEFGVPEYPEHADLLAAHQIDVVAIGSVYSDRADAVVDCLSAGIDLIVDKPLCIDLQQLARIEDAAARTDRQISVLFEKRFSPLTRAVRELISAGDLGEIVQVAASAPHKLNRAVRPDWFFKRATYGGIIGDLATHDIDLALLFTELTSGTVCGATGNAAVLDAPEFSDHGSVLIAGQTASALLEVSWLSPAAAPAYGDCRMRVTGTLGTAELYFNRGYVDVLTDRDGPRTLRPDGTTRGAANAIDAFLAGATPEVDTAASIAATRLALLAQQSADSGSRSAEWSLD